MIRGLALGERGSVQPSTLPQMKLVRAVAALLNTCGTVSSFVAAVRPCELNRCPFGWLIGGPYRPVDTWAPARSTPRKSSSAVTILEPASNSGDEPCASAPSLRTRDIRIDRSHMDRMPSPTTEFSKSLRGTTLLQRLTAVLKIPDCVDAGWGSKAGPQDCLCFVIVTSTGH